MALLTPLMKAVEGSAWGGRLVRARRGGAGDAVVSGCSAGERASAEDRDLAA